MPASVPLADPGSGDRETVSSDRIAWTGRLDAGEKRVTTYGMDADPDEMAGVDAPPTVESVRPESPVSGAGAACDRLVGVGNGDSDPS
ncbi:hypothetical protein BRD03_09900 [Halobacteriales archaeon QS_9_68_17]|nr:MAG: hypothetical protein BRD03_09900 [Halobacteriales archaeon QS_9_68_17]